MTEATILHATLPSGEPGIGSFKSIQTFRKELASGESLLAGELGM